MQFMTFILEKWKIIGIVIIVLAILNGVLGKPKWQQYPLYIVAAIYLLLVLLNYLKVLELNASRVKWILGIGIFLILFSIFTMSVFPKSKFPKPSGKFAVGTRIFDLEDQSRTEKYSENADENRKIKYQVWYPTDKTKNLKKAKWIHDGVIVTRQLASSMHLPGFVLDQTRDIYSNSFLEAEISKSLDKYPVVLISHGWKGFRELHTDYAEELASNGFIAISIDHTYGSQVVKFKDGSLAYISEKALPRETAPFGYNKNSNLLVKTYGNDVSSVIDDLERLNQSHRDFKNILDLEEIGLLGHSTGGGGDVFIAMKDNRIKALLGLDAWVSPLEPEVLKQGLKIPSLFLRSEQWSKGPNNIALDSIFKNSNNTTLITMDKTNHVDFTMTYMFSPITKYVGFTGKLGGRYSSDIQKEFILSFFNENLKNKNGSNNDYIRKVVDNYDHLEIVNPL